MIKIVKAAKYSHCSSCGRANEYAHINAYTPDVVKVYNIKLCIDDSSEIYSFGICKECLKKLRKEIKHKIGKRRKISNDGIN